MPKKGASWRPKTTPLENDDDGACVKLCEGDRPGRPVAEAPSTDADGCPSSATIGRLVPPENHAGNLRGSAGAPVHLNIMDRSGPNENAPEAAAAGPVAVAVRGPRRSWPGATR